MCTNEHNKVAKFLTYSEEETLYYCEKCAILLASQGFTVVKLNTGESMEINPRKEEVDGFLGELEGVLGLLGKKKQMLNMSIDSAHQAF